MTKVSATQNSVDKFSILLALEKELQLQTLANKNVNITMPVRRFGICQNCDGLTISRLVKGTKHE